MPEPLALDVAYAAALRAMPLAGDEAQLLAAEIIVLRASVADLERVDAAARAYRRAMFARQQDLDTTLTARWELWEALGADPDDDTPDTGWKPGNRHCVKSASYGWFCIWCDGTFPTWPSDDHPCPGPRPEGGW